MWVPVQTLWPYDNKSNIDVSTQAGWNGKVSGMYRASKLFSGEIFGAKAPEDYSALTAADIQFGKLVKALLPHIGLLYEGRNLVLEYTKECKYDCDLAFIHIVYHYSFIVGVTVFPQGLFEKWPPKDDKWMSYVPERKYLMTAADEELMATVDLAIEGESGPLPVSG